MFVCVCACVYARARARARVCVCVFLCQSFPAAVHQVHPRVKTPCAHTTHLPTRLPLIISVCFSLKEIQRLRKGQHKPCTYYPVTNCNSFHARVGRFSPFCIRGLWSLLYLWSVAMALISFWLHLVFLVFLMSLCSTCSSVPRIRERSSSQFGDRQPRVLKHPKTVLKIATHDS